METESGAQGQNDDIIACRIQRHGKKENKVKTMNETEYVTEPGFPVTVMELVDSGSCIA